MNHNFHNSTKLNKYFILFSGFVAHQQPQQVIQARPQQAPYTNYRAPQLRMPTMINRSGQMNFQQPPPSVTGQQPPGPQQPPQPQTSQQPQNNFVGHQGIIQQQQTPMFTLNPSMVSLKNSIFCI